MKYYSEKIGKIFDTERECRIAEAKHDERQARARRAEAEKRAERQKREEALAEALVDFVNVWELVQARAAELEKVL